MSESIEVGRTHMTVSRRWWRRYLDEIEKIRGEEMSKRRKRKFRFVYRSSITGGFVSAAYAKRHPKTTERQRVRA